MGRWFFWFLVFLMIGGILLHLHVEIPWISHYLGHLPGDLILNKNQFTIYLPFTSSAIISLIFSLILWIFSKKEQGK